MERYHNSHNDKTYKRITYKIMERYHNSHNDKTENIKIIGLFTS